MVGCPKCTLSYLPSRCREGIGAVTTAKALGAKNQDDLQAVLEGFLKKDEIRMLEMFGGPSLIGGMIGNIGDKYVGMCTSSKGKTYTKLQRAF